MVARAPLLGEERVTEFEPSHVTNNQGERVEWFNGYGNVILTVTYTTHPKGMMGRVGLGSHLL